MLKIFDKIRNLISKNRYVYAFLFYLISLIFGFLLWLFISYSFAIFFWGENVPRYYYSYLTIGIAFVYNLALLLFVFFNLKLWKNIKAIVLGLLSMILSFIFGLVLSLIPAACLIFFGKEDKDV